MTIVKKSRNARITIDLTGPDGNVFTLMAKGSALAKKIGVDWKPIQSEMMSGNYENAVQAFDSTFGDYVTLYR